jgi:hypothetical protein
MRRAANGKFVVGMVYSRGARKRKISTFNGFARSA